MKKCFRICAAILIMIALCLGIASGCTGSVPNDTQTQTDMPQTDVPQTEEPQTEEPQTEEPSSSDECDALFYGDSITKGNNFDELFPDLRIVDKGINGATIEDLTQRVDEVDEYHPKKIFVMAGGNNLYSGNVEECVELFRGLLNALKEACPYAEIYVESMLPTDKRVAVEYDCPNRVIKGFNERLKALAEENGMTYVEIYPAYEKNGGLNKELTFDGIHLKDDAYGPWADLVRPYLEP